MRLAGCIVGVLRVAFPLLDAETSEPSSPSVYLVSVVPLGCVRSNEFALSYKTRRTLLVIIKAIVERHSCLTIFQRVIRRVVIVLCDETVNQLVCGLSIRLVVVVVCKKEEDDEMFPMRSWASEDANACVCDDNTHCIVFSFERLV